MKYNVLCVAVLIFFVLTPLIGAQENDFSVLTGPYLGQTPPVDKPLLFARGIVSTDAGNHSSPAFSPDGKEMYWSMGEKIWFTRLENDRWTKPEMLSMCKGDSYMYDNPFISTDGKRLLFTSTRPVDGIHKESKSNIWYAEKTSSGWTDPRSVGSEVNAVPLHWSISVSDSGTLCFQSQEAGGETPRGIGDIHYSKLVNGKYVKPVRFGPAINTPATETCPHIAPDESYIVFTRFDETDVKNTGIFISYRDKSGEWLPAVMAEGGTKEKGGLSPRISPDGKYLFYVNGGTWWMPARFIETLRPKE